MTINIKSKKRKKPFNATRASVKLLESEGWTCEIVEKRIPHCFITKDCFGFGDILAASPSRGIMLVQTTGGGNGPNRISKTRGEPRHAIWLASGGRIAIHDWRKRVGKERECVIVELT